MIGRLVLAAACLAAPAALADPCRAIPDHGPAPAYAAPGATFSGPVTYVGDGDSLCVATGADPSRWVEVRLADFYAPELHDPAGPAAKQALERMVLGRRLTCQADHQSYDRMVSRCTLGGRSVGDLLRAAGVPEGGHAYRR
jgi:endonuclease YncB( thermonuclease family)